MPPADNLPCTHTATERGGLEDSASEMEMYWFGTSTYMYLKAGVDQREYTLKMVKWN